MDYIISDSWDGQTRKLYPVNCAQCPKTFYAPKRNPKKKNIKFCSRECFNLSQRNQVECTCCLCNKTFMRRPSCLNKSKSGLTFCSRQCKDNGQSIEYGLKELWPPSYFDGSSNYRKIAFRYHPKKCNRCGYSEYWQILRVHHKDRDHSNSTSDNLEILCPTCHELEHFLANDGLYTRARKKRADVVDYAGIEPA